VDESISSSAQAAKLNAKLNRAHHARRGLRYALRIFAGVVVLWKIAAAFGDYSPVWATVSLVMTSELEMRLSLFASSRRFAHMAIGCGVALLTLWAVRPNLWEYAAAVTAAALISFFVMEIGGNWRAAGAATAIVAGSRYDTFTRSAGMQEGVVRSAEVLGGCVVALVVAWAANEMWSIFEAADARSTK